MNSDVVLPMPQAGAVTTKTVRRLGFCERYLSLWVALCMIGGILLGTFMPTVVAILRDTEIGQGSHLNLLIALLIWLMIVPMVMRVDFISLRYVGRRPSGLLVTLIVNWLVKPVSMALLAWLFFRHVFPAWISPGMRINTSPERSSSPPRPALLWCSSGVI